MLTVGFVVTPGFPIMSLAALSVFEFANLHAKRNCYEVHVLSEHGGQVATAMGTALHTTAFDDRHFDTLIIGGNTEVVPTSPKLARFVSAAAQRSRRISSICTGAFALADAGLLDNRRVTTHWLFTEALKTHYPKLRLEADRIYITDGPIWTAAGNSAGIDLTLGMLEKDYGPELARDVAQIMLINQGRAGGVADQALELAEIAEIGGDGIANPADHGHVHHHPERRHPAGPAGELPRLAIGVEPVRQGVVAADDHVDGALSEELFN
jgi:transcriptional regulator GlxA family with amidase domain